MTNLCGSEVRDRRYPNNSLDTEEANARRDRRHAGSVTADL
jgi:hypothetical protein